MSLNNTIIGPTEVGNSGSGESRAAGQSQVDDCSSVEELLPNHIRQFLKACPKAGCGVHNFLIRAAVRLHRCFEDQNIIAALLEKHTADCGRDVSDEEIWNAINSAEAWVQQQHGKPRDFRATRRWPGRNEELISNITKAGPNLAQVEATSPLKWSDGAPHTEEIIDALFTGNPLLCASTRKESALTRTREEWRGILQNQQFIVPSPMSAVRGKTKSGRDSMRALSNTGPRRFLVIEFDQGDFDQHAALLFHLAKFAPLAMVVHSGNKSLHGWFYCAGQDEEKLLRFMRYAVSIGADHATWTPCQFVRMPNGRRENDKRQRVVYFNPSVMEVK